MFKVLPRYPSDLRHSLWQKLFAAASIILLGAFIAISSLKYFFPDMHFSYVNIGKTDRIVGGDYLRDINFYIDNRHHPIYRIDSYIGIALIILFTSWVISAIYSSISYFSTSRADIRSADKVERLPSKSGIAQMTNSSDRSLEVDYPFEGTIITIDELGIGSVEFKQDKLSLSAVFTPEVTWQYPKVKWLKPGQKVKGRLYPSGLGFRITFIEKGGAA